MNDHIKDELMQAILAGLLSQDDEPALVKASLQLRGYDADKETAAFSDRLEKLITRHTWKDHAQVKQRAFSEKLSALKSWATRTDTEINAAFGRLLARETAARPQGQLALAFRNLEAITRDEKIAVLDDAQFLNGDEP